MTDARFEDGAERPLRLAAASADDLQVVSALTQDAVFPVSEIAWQPTRRRFALLVNRFRWERDGDRQAAERVQAVLAAESVLGVASQGFDRSDPDLVLSLLAVAFEPAEPPSGTVLMTLAGDGAIRLTVECLDITLTDVTRPYRAPSGKVPFHPD